MQVSTRLQENEHRTTTIIHCQIQQRQKINAFPLTPLHPYTLSFGQVFCLNC
jgi:hypothetical protein